MRDRFARDRQQPFEAHFIAADATQVILLPLQKEAIDINYF